MLPPTMPGHSHRVAPTFDPDRARTLLSEAGHPDGRALGEITLACLDLWEDAATDIAAQLAAIGIRVRLLPTTSDPEGAAAIERGAHAYLWALGRRPPRPGRRRPRAPFKWYRRFLYRDEQLEKLLSRAATLHDQDERLRTYREFERIWIGEQAAVVPLAYNDRLLWRRPWLTGMWANAIAMSTFADPDSFELAACAQALVLVADAGRSGEQLLEVPVPVEVRIPPEEWLPRKPPPGSGNS